MATLSFRQVALIAPYALVLWALCGALMFAVMSLMPLQYALIVHAIGAPAIAALVAWFYFKRFYAPPLLTALLFMLVVIFMDVFVVALLIEQSFAMFTSVVGTWLPFALIFLVTFFTGHLGGDRSRMIKASQDR